MSEKSLWTLTREGIKSVVPAHEMFLRRIEDSAGVGTLDVNYCIRKSPGWIELKFLEAFPKRKTTPIQLPHFTQDQKTFLHDLSMAGGRGFVWMQVGPEYFLFDGMDAALNLGYVSKSDPKAAWTREGFNAKALLHMKRGHIDWNQFVERITK